MRHFTFIVDEEILLAYLRNDPVYMNIIERLIEESANGLYDLIILEESLEKLIREVKGDVAEGKGTFSGLDVEKFLRWVIDLTRSDVLRVNGKLKERARDLQRRYKLELDDALIVSYAVENKTMALFLEPKDGLREVKKEYSRFVAFLRDILYIE